MRSLSGLSLSGEQLDKAVMLMDAMDAMRADMECCQCPGAKELFAEWDEFYNYDTGFTNTTILAQVVDYHDKFRHRMTHAIVLARSRTGKNWSCTGSLRL